MKQILMSIQSKWLAKILNGDKTVELRKRFPKDYRGWVYLYCTKGKDILCRYYDGHWFTTKDRNNNWKMYLNGKVVARVWVDNVEEVFVKGDNADHYMYHTSSLNQEELLCKSCVNAEYLWAHLILLPKPLLAIHISKLEIFDNPKWLIDFKTNVYPNKKDSLITKSITKAPQSWQYIYIEEESK